MKLYLAFIYTIIKLKIRNIMIIFFFLWESADVLFEKNTIYIDAIFTLLL